MAPKKADITLSTTPETAQHASQPQPLSGAGNGPVCIAAHAAQACSCRSRGAVPLGMSSAHSTGALTIPLCEQESDGPSTTGKQPKTANGRGHWDGCPWGFWQLSALSAVLAVTDLFYPHQVLKQRDEAVHQRVECTASACLNRACQLRCPPRRQSPRAGQHGTQSSAPCKLGIESHVAASGHVTLISSPCTTKGCSVSKSSA